MCQMLGRSHSIDYNVIVIAAVASFPLGNENDVRVPIGIHVPLRFDWFLGTARANISCIHCVNGDAFTAVLGGRGPAVGVGVVVVDHMVRSVGCVE